MSYFVSYANLIHQIFYYDIYEWYIIWYYEAVFLIFYTYLARTILWVCRPVQKLLLTFYYLSLFLHLSVYKFLLQFINSCQIHKKRKISFESRYPLETILKHCNVIVSNTYDWDLNFLHLECLHLGIPLIHNSPFLKDAGYYYEKNDISTAVNHLRRIKHEFDRETYIEQGKQVLAKYSIHNSEYRSWYCQRLLWKKCLQI